MLAAKPPRPNGLRPRPRALLGVPLGGVPLGGVPLDQLGPAAGGLPKFASHPGCCLCCPGHRVPIWRPIVVVATAPSLCDRCGDGAAGGDGAAASRVPPPLDAGAAAVPGSIRLGDSPSDPHTRLRPGASGPCCVFAELWRIEHRLAEPSVSSSESSAPGMSAGRRRITSAPLADWMTMRGVLTFEPTSLEEPIDSSRTRRSSASSCETRVASAETVSSCSRRARSRTELRSASSCASRSRVLTMPARACPGEVLRRKGGPTEWSQGPRVVAR